MRCSLRSAAEGCVHSVRGSGGAFALGAGVENGGCEDAPAVNDRFGGLAVGVQDAVEGFEQPVESVGWQK